MVTFSGLYITVPGWFDFSSDNQGEMPRERRGPPAEVNVDEVLGKGYVLAQEEFNQREGISYFFHPRAKKLFVNTQQGRFTFDPDTNVFKAPQKNDPRANSFRGLMHRLHVGHFWSWFGEFLVFISGVLAVLFYISGIYLWVKKSKMRWFKF